MQSSGAHAPGKHHLFSWTRDLTGCLPRAPSRAAATPPPAEPTSPVLASHTDMQEEEEQERFCRREEAYTQLFGPSLHCLMETGALFLESSPANSGSYEGTFPARAGRTEYSPDAAHVTIRMSRQGGWAPERQH